jgi:hypothetical protein
MLLLVSGATQSIEKHGVGVLVVPKQWNLVERLPLEPGRWAMDNGCFAGFDEGAFVRMLERFSGLGGRAQGNGCDGSTPTGCLFVVAPDVVADAAATLKRWPFWSQLIRGLGYPVAFVAQDGQTVDALPTDLDAVFIGGSTAFKEGPIAGTLCAYAKARGLWVHMGRVNSKRRLKIAQAFGVDSYDGTGVNVAPDIVIPKMRRFDAEAERERQQQPVFHALR